MGLIREPKNVDFIIKSEPWTKDELKKLREIMKQQKERRAKLKARVTKKRGTKARTPNKVHMPAWGNR
jgi:molybdate-binding protein